MASKYQLENIEFKLHDILNISSLGQKFDYIVSTGVLHHMSSPQAGLNALAKQLKSNRLMVLGFYSKQGRRQLKEIRDNLIRFFNANGVQDITKSSLPEWRHSWSEEQKRALWFYSNDFF
jgi:2-polyprenyl-3-methyl-5-hydroxy-6-metoxy-1,4-benzoquinol methylase